MAKQRDAKTDSTDASPEQNQLRALPVKLLGIDLRLAECNADASEGVKPSSLNVSSGTEFQVSENHDKFRVKLSFCLSVPKPQADPPRSLIRTVYYVHYQVTSSKDSLSDDLWIEVYDTTLKSALVNTWPYWREIVSDMTTKMNMPRFTLPLLDIGAVMAGTPMLLDGKNLNEDLTDTPEMPRKTTRKKTKR
jgi:hypothetical protein